MSGYDERWQGNFLFIILQNDSSINAFDNVAFVFFFPHIKGCGSSSEMDFDSQQTTASLKSFLKYKCEQEDSRGYLIGIAALEKLALDLADLPSHHDH